MNLNFWFRLSSPCCPEGSSTQANAQFNASWEIDLFGGQRAGALAAVAQANAATADWHAARVSLAADVAQAYVQLRLAQAQLSSITGAFSSDDLLGVIFGRFCIGK